MDPSTEFYYEMIPLVRGLVDTALLDAHYYKQATYLDDNYKYMLAMSPLIVEGEIEKIYNLDTSAASKPHIFFTNYVVRTTDVIYSRYKVKAGDRVLIKDCTLGYSYDHMKNRVSYMEFAERQFYYEAGKKYLFVCNKYGYMSMCYYVMQEQPRKNYEEYCPYAFAVNYSLSDAYTKGNLTKEQIKRFLKIK